jgi:hypothetical protein
MPRLFIEELNEDLFALEEHALLGWGNPVRKVVKKAIIILLLIFIH